MVALGIFMMSVAGIANAQEVNEQNPYELVQDVANRTFERIKANQAAIKADCGHWNRTVCDEVEANQRRVCEDVSHSLP